MDKRAKIRFHDVVVVEIRPGDMQSREDIVKLIDFFIVWTIKEGIHPVHLERSRPTRCVGYFRHEDADRVVQWLTERNRILGESECPSCRCPDCGDRYCVKDKCMWCTGEACVVHGQESCECDSLERHGSF